MTLAVHTHAFAQSNDDTAVVTYDKEFFEKYSPTTLLDLLERIPGTQDVLERRDGRGGGDRGFGSSGDQILLDGQRISSKSNSIRDILERTPASQVERVELIRGAADGLDVQTEGLVINVVMIEGADSSSLFWRVGGTYKTGENVSPDIEVSYKDKLGNLDYTLTGEAYNRHNYFGREDTYFDAEGLQTGTRELDGRFRFKGFDLNSNLTYNFENGDVLNLNGKYNPNDILNDRFFTETGDNAEVLHYDVKEGFMFWEIGGDYSTDFGFLGKFKTIFLMGGEENSDFINNRFTGEGADQYIYNVEVVEFATSEDIFRASLTTPLTSNMTLEYGAEGAFNNFMQLYQDSDRDAQGDPLILSTSNNVKIKENRYEVFAHHNYTIRPGMVLQTSLTTEFSEIIADTLLVEGGTVRDADSFTFFKPRLNFRYDVTYRNQIRLIAEKKVSQLEFFHYMTWFDEQTKELKVGNTSIRPEQKWEFSATYEHRLANDGGTLEAEFFYHDYKDYITRIDFSEYQDFGGNPITADAFFALPPTMALRDEIDFTSKSGNIDHASSVGFELKSDTRLGIIGVPEAQLGLTYKYEKRRFNDPFTQESRAFDWVSDHSFKVNFRHDVTRWNLSYGGEAEFRSDFINRDIRHNWIFDSGTEVELFVEYKIFGDIKLRVEGKQERNTNEKATFLSYTDHRRFNEFKGREEHINTRPREIEFSIEGTF